MSNAIAKLAEIGLLDMAKSICAAHSVTIGQVCGGARHTSIVAARHALWAYVREATGKSYPEIGELFGRDHTTVLVAIRKARPRIDAGRARAALRVI